MFLLKKFEKSDHRNGTIFQRVTWYVISSIFFETNIPFPKNIKIMFLRVFGGEIGDGLIIKPSVKIKYPWNLRIANHVWIGERVWIDNMDIVEIQENVCISQNTMLQTGSHNFKSIGFDLITKPILIQANSWIGCGCLILPGTTIETGSIFYAGSVIRKKTTADAKVS